METKKNETYAVNIKETAEKWKGKTELLNELLIAAALQCSAYFGQISESLRNLGTFIEQNKDLAPFLKVSVVTSGEIELLGEKGADLVAVTGHKKGVMECILKLSESIKESA